MLLGTDRYASLDTLATHLQDMSAQSIDRSEPISAQLEWLALAAGAAAGWVDGPAFERAHARIATEPDTPLVVHDLVDALTTLVEHPAERAEAARAFLRSMAPE